jgi:cellobiose phosphorylase
MYRIAVENVLGLTRQGSTLQVAPCVPPSWTEFQVTYRYAGSELLLAFENPEGVATGVQRIELDGVVLDTPHIPLTDDGRRHRVRVVMGEASSSLERPRPALPEPRASRAAGG